MIFGLIPAAGKSSRMGVPKLALPLGERTVLEHVIGTLREAGVPEIVVVVGHHVPALARLAEKAGAHALLLPEETAEMRQTVELGLAWIEARFHPDPNDDWLLLPADHPTLDPEIIRALIAARQANPERSIVVPTFQGKRGHPVLLTWSHVASIRTFSPAPGLNSYLRQQAEQTLEITVDHAEILCDLDTPEDYDRLQWKTWPRPKSN
jgi:molybdenum cofactor cytidylyltransferase